MSLLTTLSFMDMIQLQISVLFKGNDKYLVLQHVSSSYSESEKEDFKNIKDVTGNYFNYLIPYNSLYFLFFALLVNYA